MTHDLFTARKVQIAFDTLLNPAKALLGGPTFEEAKAIMQECELWHFDKQEAVGVLCNSHTNYTLSYCKHGNHRYRYMVRLNGAGHVQYLLNWKLVNKTKKHQIIENVFNLTITK